ncbi:hypothetical protein ACILDU_11200 [Capnocytophaga canimorsus]|uniref:hypothetical protein n=1 Tax=Capnocytophaga canimorsus TaxID=28188 RepID=UPI0037CF0F71
MEEEKINLYNALKQNRANVRIAFIGACVVAVVAIVVVYLMHIHNSKLVYGLSKDKSLLPLELIEKREVEDIYKKGSIELFMSLFYTIDQYNYESQIEKSLWLIDSESGKRLYERYRQTGHFNTLIQTSSSQYLQEVQIAFEDNRFKAQAVVVISTPNQKQPKKYALLVEGFLQEVTPNYPKNPYGYLIYSFKEISKHEIVSE